jgi:hypothetical protein
MNGPATMIVPEGFVFEPIHNILMAMKSAIIKKENALESLKALKAKFECKIDLLLVKTPFHKEGDFDVNDELSALVDDITTTENATTFQGVLRHYESHNPNMLCVVRRKRGFFTKKWEKNVILKKDFSSSIPVLVLSELK